jgi:hypothetical protein
MNRGKNFAGKIIPWRGGPPTRGGFGRGHIPGRGRSQGFNNGGNNGDEYNRVECQLCGKKWHIVLKCFKHFNRAYTGEEKSASTATTYYDVDTNWYGDSCATDHITMVLEKLTVCDKYLSNDQIHIASGSGMRITQVGRSVIHTPNRHLFLYNVLYVLEANKNLVSVHYFTCDNHVYLELHPWHFLIKGQTTRRILHHDKVEGGLYLLKSSEKQVLAVTKPS